MDYKSDPDNIGKWEKFFRWVNGEDSLDSVWEKEIRSKITGRRKKRRKTIEETIEKINSYSKKIYIILSVFVTVVYIGILLYTVYTLPEHGNALNPANNEVSERYIEHGVEETGALNIVSAMILDYRAFDTFGESVVLFTAVICVAMLLRKTDSDKKDIDYDSFKSDRGDILKFAARPVFPIVVLYGIYVILNGHISPGGGFSGGTIIGAALILYSASYGDENVRRILNYKSFTAVTVACLLIYFFSKGYSFFTGGNHIESVIPKGTPGNILSGGLILPLNICVGIVVACTMYGFYSYFTKGDI